MRPGNRLLRRAYALFFHFLARGPPVFGLFTSRRWRNRPGGLYWAQRLTGNCPDVRLLIKTLLDGTGTLALHATLRVQGGPMLRQIGTMELLVIILVAMLL